MTVDISNTFCAKVYIIGEIKFFIFVINVLVMKTLEGRDVFDGQG